MLEDLKKDAATRMAKCVQNFQADLKKLRTARAHPSLIEHLKVDYYGSEVLLHRVASIRVGEGRLREISPWEQWIWHASRNAAVQTELRRPPTPSRTFICLCT